MFFKNKDFRDCTELLSEFVYGLKYEDIPVSAIECTKAVILDWYSASFAGMKVNSAFNRAVHEVMLSGASGNASELCSPGGGLSETDAAFMNAVYAHGADMDDGNRLSMGHVAAHVISAVFAVAEQEVSQGKIFSGKDITVAVNAGYEIFNRVAAAVQPSLVKRGFHSTGTAGGIACAAAVAKLLGMDADGIYRAISLAALQSSGLIIIAESGQGCKPLNPANAARIGILSARLAMRGVAAPVNPLESEKGWFHAMGDTVNYDRITAGLGEVFTVTEGYLKPYPSCRHTHCPISLAISLRERIIVEYGCVPIEKIRGITVFTYENAIRIAGQIAVPHSDEDTKFSIAYGLAQGLFRGRFGLDELSLSALDGNVSEIINKITFVPTPEMEQAENGIRGARVEIAFSDGRVFDGTELIPKGDAARPFTKKDMENKLYSCSDGILSAEQRKRLTGWIAEFENCNFRSLNDFLN